MREPSFPVLTALARGRAHGRAVLRDVEGSSSGRVRPPVGSSYAVLDRLGADGLIAVDGEERHDGRLRRCFVLTDRGAVSLEAANAAAAERRLARRVSERPVLGP